MKASELITQAKIRLILNQPFFATLALGMVYKSDSSVPTACCDGKTVRYNDTFIQSMNVDQCAGLIAHEVLHPALLHHLRLQGRDKTLFNKSADYAINPLLVNSGMKIPADGLIDSRFENLSAEEIYNVLFKEQQKQKQKQSGSGEPGTEQNENNEPEQSDEPDPDSPEAWGQFEQPQELTTDNQEELEAEVKQQLVQAYNAAKMAGKGSPMLERLVQEIITSKIDWKETLQRFIAEVAHNDYTWIKPSPRYLPAGLYLPKLENLEVGKVVFAIDTSSSVDDKILSSFIAELKEAASVFNFPVTVIHCPDYIAKVEELDQDEDIKPVGRGGTDFRPPFEYTEENLPETKALVYLTDGYCRDFPAVEPGYPVLWVIYNNTRFTPPFGEVIYIK